VPLRSVARGRRFVITPEVHAWLLGTAAVASLLLRGIVLARNPDSTAARCHALFGFTVAWWFFCTAEIAIAATDQQVALFTRLAHVAVGFLPALVFHLHVATAGLQTVRRRAVAVHYLLSVAVTLFCLTWPRLFEAPRLFAWGYYPMYTAWGLIPAGYLLLVLIEVPLLYRARLQAYRPGSVGYAKTRALYVSNVFSPIVLVDFLTAFGVPVYTFGYVVITVMNVGTLFAALRYRLIEVTPQFAAAEIVATIPDALLVVDSQGAVCVANSAAAQMFGSDARSLVGRQVDTVTQDSKLRDLFAAPLRTAPPSDEIEVVREDGARRNLNVTGSVLEINGAPLARIWLLRDVTELRAAVAENARLEDWVRQQQKLETLGVMAGGVAHDFNNLLMSILGNVERAQSNPGGAPVAEELRIIATAAQRAAELTRQLLTYAGRDRSLRVPTELNSLVREITELMLTAVSRKTRLQLEPAQESLWVMADASQIRQVVLNLVTNASESLGDQSGWVTIRTGTVREPEFLPLERRCSSDDWIRLEVSDNGSGMDAATRERMFEPFFTTKFTGRGLGLAMVSGIVRAHDGWIDVHTAPGEGTRVTVILPAIPLASVPPPSAPESDHLDADWHGHGLVLLADDEAVVRQVTREMLQGIGFDVVEASDGAEAVARFREQSRPVRLLVLDRTMPEMSGNEAYAAIRAQAGPVPTVFISGYALDQDAAFPGTASLSKPFTRQKLIAAIRHVLAYAEV
jgi:PAS domain S-box-containing protein